MVTRSIRPARAVSQRAAHLPVRGETEAQFQAAVIELARYCGWLVFHDADSRRSEPGFPDLVMTRGGRLLLIELKTQRGHLRPAQRTWLGALSLCLGVEVAVWRPQDWQTILEALTPYTLTPTQRLPTPEGRP